MRSLENEERFKNKALRSYMKTFSDFQLRMKEAKQTKQLKILASMKRENERK